MRTRKNIMYSCLLLLLIASADIVSARQATPRRFIGEIARGACRTQYSWAGTIYCSLPLATPTMVLEIFVQRQISSVPCVLGQNFGLTRDNGYVWISNVCVAEFYVGSVVQTTRSSITTSSPPMTSATTSGLHTTTALLRTTTGASRTSNSSSCGRAGGNGFRIIGGTEADNCQFPWLAMLYNYQSGVYCGGTIIDSTHILTAAHCVIVENKSAGTSIRALANNITVFTGSSSMPFGTQDADGIVRRSVSEIITHENYTSLTNDITILKLTRPIIFDACHQPLCVVDGSKTPQQATNCKTMGWGTTYNGESATEQIQMKYVDIPVSSDAECNRFYPDLSSIKTFCAGGNGEGHCHGDSGGPFTCQEADGRYYIYGIVSAVKRHSCGINPGLYTRVSTFLNWIRSKTQ
uniref:Peptidase S1 domain-containing protein n=1 Tax=Arion vulgaris TaxID=1028688 RepID=A0A0B7B5I0_9EUPU